MSPILRSLLFLALAISATTAFAPSPALVRTTQALKAAESEVDFAELDGEGIRVGIIRTRWNKEYVDSLVEGAKEALLECNVKEDDIFIKEVPGSFELPLAARFLAMSGTVDAIICAGVLIKGETLHFEYISEAVSSGLMSAGLQTLTPIVFGVLTCLNESQVKARSMGQSNHGRDWGKTAVEMALLKREASGLNLGKGAEKLAEMGFGKSKVEESKERVGFF